MSASNTLVAHGAPVRSLDWWEDHRNLRDLWFWLDGRAERPDPADFIDKPWKWTPEWDDMRAAAARQAVER
jgi:hypothetical protein